jgi:hypothetical protein
MPRVPDASSVTRARAIQSSAVADPTKRSASYIPAQPSLLFSLRSSDVGRGMFPGQTYLSSPVQRRYVNSRHQGYLTGPPPAAAVASTRLTFDLGSTDFDVNDLVTGAFAYEFGAELPPATTFEVALTNGINVGSICGILISSFDGESYSPTFGSTTITTTPVWPGSTDLTTSQQGWLSASTPSFPGVSTVITFQNVPLITNVRIVLGGISYAE